MFGAGSFSAGAATSATAGAVSSAASTAFTQAASGQKLDGMTILKSAGIGALSAVAAYGIGHLPALEKLWSYRPKCLSAWSIAAGELDRDNA